MFVEGNVDGTIGGSFFSLLFLVASLDRELYEPLVVFAAHNSLLPRFHAAGVRTLIRALPTPVIGRGLIGRWRAKAQNFLRGWFVEPRRLARLMKEERIDLLHLNNSIITNHTWMLAARLARLPCITHERGINEGFSSRTRHFARRLDAIICISAAVHDNFKNLGLGDLRMVTIHNGLDPAEMKVVRTPLEVRAEHGIAPNARLIGIVGNIKPWKGQEVVIRAMARLRTEFPDLVCMLIGDTSPNDTAYRVEVLNMIRDLGLEGRVIVTGYREDVPDYVNVLEIQVHASVLPEPFGRVLLEAMALEKPLVASGGGAVPEIVIEGETGLMFEPGNAEALAAALQKLLHDPERGRALGRAGRSRLEREFSISHNVKQTQDLYRQLLG